ncbi:hypothetical protein IJS64_03035 [bacterium]|nr:hypothetical protein [bacterium]
MISTESHVFSSEIFQVRVVSLFSSVGSITSIIGSSISIPGSTRVTSSLSLFFLKSLANQE